MKRKLHHLTSIPLVLLLTFFVTGCPKDNSGGGLPASPKDVLQQERQHRMEVEQKLQKQEQQTESWRTIATIAGIACVIILIVGTALGSTTRSHVQTQRH
jgi:hypothetical protein